MPFWAVDKIILPLHVISMFMNEKFRPFFHKAHLMLMLSLCFVPSLIMVNGAYLSAACRTSFLFYFFRFVSSNDISMRQYKSCNDSCLVRANQVRRDRFNPRHLCQSEGYLYTFL